MAFYEALAVGQGALAAAFVVPEKRESGPLSGEALSAFYGGLKTPLQLVDVRALGEDEYEALYTYETAAGRWCNGRAVVRTVKRDDGNLIAAVEARNGC